MTGELAARNDGNPTISIHHVGILVQDIETYLANSFWSLRSSIVHDAHQKARLCLVGVQEDEHLVELIEPAGEDSPTYRALLKGQKQHHICFSVPNVKTGNTFIRRYRMLPVTKWQPAVLFQGQPVCFAYTQNRELLEFLANGSS